MINIMVADVLATQGAKASRTMMLTLLNRISLVPTRKGLNLHIIFMYRFCDCSHILGSILPSR